MAVVAICCAVVVLNQMLFMNPTHSGTTATADVARRTEQKLAIAALQLELSEARRESEKKIAAAQLESAAAKLELAEAHAFLHHLHLDVHRVQIWTIVEAQHAKSYAKQMQSLQCYASRHGYVHRILDRANYAQICKRRDFFFEKHCIVAEALRGVPDATTVVVLDADVTPANDHVSIEKFVDRSDLSFYERGQGSREEIAAGNYIVRNGAFARTFLNLWSLYDYPFPTGFSSSDNGAIHVVLARALRTSNAEACDVAYRNLTAMLDNLEPYFAFVRECRKFMAAGEYRVAGGVPPYAADEKFRANLPHPAGQITIVPTKQAFVIDGSLINWDQSGLSSYPSGRIRPLPAFFHGLKNSSLFTISNDSCAHVLRHLF